MYRGLRFVSHPPVGMRLPLHFPLIQVHKLARPIQVFQFQRLGYLFSKLQDFCYMSMRYHRDQKGRKKTTEKISSRRRVRTRKDEPIEDPYRSSTSIQPSNKRIRRRIKGTTKGNAEVDGKFSSPLHNYKCLVYFPLLRGYSVIIL